MNLHRPSPLRAAFSLVEVLVVLLIVSGIMLAITQLLEAARISRDTIYNIQETQLAGPAIVELIERDLRGLAVVNRDPRGLLRVVDRTSAGLDSDSLDFVTTTDSLIPVSLRDRVVRADMNEVGYRLRPNPENDDFLEIYRRESFGVDDDPFEGGSFTFLHDRVKQFEIQVYTEDGPDAEVFDEWDPRNTEQPLPLRLEIRLTLELAPRIAREQLRYAPVDRRTITYTRVIRLPQLLLDSLAVAPVPAIPRILDPAEAAQQAAGANPQGGDGERPMSLGGGGAPASTATGGRRRGRNKPAGDPPASMTEFQPGKGGG